MDCDTAVRIDTGAPVPKLLPVMIAGGLTRGAE